MYGAYASKRSKGHPVVQARAELTRAAVVRGAAVVFNREGFAGAKTVDIVRESAVSKGAVQFHFRTKDDLARAVVDQFTRDFDTASRPPVSKDDSSLAVAVELSAVIARQLVEEPIVGAAFRLTMEESAFASRVTRPYMEAIGVFEELFRQAASQGELRQGVNVEDLARYVVGSFIGVQLVSNTLTSRTDLIQRMADMWAFLLPSVAAPKRVNYHLGVARSTFVSHYAKSRIDLVRK